MSKTEKARDPYDGLRPWSAITHGGGIALALLASPFLLLAAARSGRQWAIVAMLVYLTTLVALYTASTLYHSLNTSVKGRIILRKIDHLNIFYLIAGSYTPFCILALGGLWGMVLLLVIWSLAIGGTLVKLVWIHLPRWLTVSIYLLMGWISVTAIYPLSQSLGFWGTFWLIGGGLFYTVGAVLYAVKWPGRNWKNFGCHEIFHLFILGGSISHFIAIWGIL